MPHDLPQPINPTGEPVRNRRKRRILDERAYGPNGAVSAGKRNRVYAEYTGYDGGKFDTCVECREL